MAYLAGVIILAIRWREHLRIEFDHRRVFGLPAHAAHSQINVCGHFAGVRLQPTGLFDTGGGWWLECVTPSASRLAMLK